MYSQTGKILDMVSKRYIFYIFFITVIVFFNTLFFEFVWDDNYQIITNYDIRTLEGLLKLIFSPIPSMPNYYRPTFIISLYMDYGLWGLNPLGYHLTNLILSILNNILIFFISSMIFKNNRIGFITAIIFAIHPTHAEPVAYISARNELICTFFLFLSLIFYLKFRLGTKKSLTIILSTVFYFFSLLSKENAVIMPLLIFLYELSFHKNDINKSFKFLFFFVLATLIYFLLRLKFTTLSENAPLIHRLLTFPKIFVYDLFLLFFPFFHKTFYQVDIINNFFDKYFLFYLLFLIIFLSGSLIISKYDKRLFFCLKWVFITLIPVSTLITLIYPTLIAERYLYLPSVGFSMFLAVIFNDIYDLSYKKKPFLKIVLKYLFFVVSIIFAIVTIFRNLDYKSNMDFWYHAKRKAPYEPYVLDKWAQICLEKKYFPQAEIEFLKLAGSDFYNPQVHHRLGNLYREWGKYNLAEQSYYKSLEVAPDYFVVLPDLGRLYLKIGQVDRSLNIYLEYLKADQNNFYVLFALAELFFNYNELDTAIYYLKKTLEINPNFDSAYYLYGLIYENEKKYKQAYEMYQKAFKIMPREEKYLISMQRIKDLNDGQN